MHFADPAEWQDYLTLHPETRYLDTVVIDLCGNAIGKRLPVSQVAGILGRGTPVCGAMQLVDVMGNTADPMGHGFSDGDPDGLARPLAGGFMPIPWSNGAGAQALCVMCDPETALPYWYEPRAVLDAVAKRFESLGVKPVLALELEFYLIDQKRGPFGEPLPAASPFGGRREGQGQVLSLAKLEEFAPVLGAIEAAAQAQGLPVTTIISEYGAGQFEINLAHVSDPLAAADHAALLRRVVRGAARAAGYDATFMSKPFAGQTGSGLHLHLSLTDGEGNVFDPARADGETRLGHAVAGLRATMAEGMAIFAPNLNVYRRFEPDAFTPVTRDWGENNRSVAFRLPVTNAGSGRRLEHRVAGAEANPYLVTAAVLAGVHHGLTQALDPGPKATGNAGSELDETLPLTLWDALAALRDAPILAGYLGARYLEIYAAVKEAEFASFREEISPREYDWYL
ncbi:glutamine synthetase family protein [Ruegeria aquimaris]|uniref:Glutamine synthetase family protein n=1 Tax=Ruegeria aquimaris TaxID=2984333 RepID=A0ABT3ANP2_9RHOB|nr:glutamine synthetase family protein [Ruegeria sp. XHP0148]MCV2890300.1 glutamine synthetase family protein [Ruegeria sp. XHP0148]